MLNSVFFDPDPNSTPKLSNSEIVLTGSKEGRPEDGCPPPQDVQEWNPSITDLPRAYYDYETVDLTEESYDWQVFFNLESETNRITNVQLAPPVHERHPFQFGELADYWGEYGNGARPCPQWVLVRLRSPGVYVIKVSFSESDPYIRFLYAGVQIQEEGSPPNGNRKLSRPKAFTPGWSDCVAIHPELFANHAPRFRLMRVNISASGSVGQMVQFISDNNCLTVTLDGHGNDSYYKYSNGQFDYFIDNEDGGLDFCDAIRRNVRGIYFVSCLVAEKLEENATHLMRAMAQRLFTGRVATFTYAPEGAVWLVETSMVRDGFWMNEGRFKAYLWDGLNGTITYDVPPPNPLGVIIEPIEITPP